MNPEIAPGLNREMLANNQIIVFKPKAIYSSVLISWMDEALRLLRTWPDNAPYLVMHDLSSRGVALVYGFSNNHDLFNLGVTEDGRQQVQDLLQGRPHLRGRLAIVLSPRLSGKFVNRQAQQPIQQNAQIESRIFLDREAGLTWLQEGLVPLASTAPSSDHPTPPQS
jgi:hypothetical protein